MNAFKTITLFSTIALLAVGCARETGPAFEEMTSEEELVAVDGTGDLNAAADIIQPLALPELTKSQEASALAAYDHLDPKKEVPTDLLKKAVLYYDANKSKFANKNYISVIDFAKSSKLKRFFIINLKTGVVWAIRTSHGKGSDPNHDGYADSFSNVSGSNKSSLGVYRTAETYTGKHGRSLRLDGLSTTNSRARARAIVIHGAAYVNETNAIQGRSQGCPAVANAHKDKVIDMVKGGSMIYAGLSTK